MNVSVHFTTRTGRQISVSAAPGTRLLDLALDSLVPGIVGQCGGGITCATCHIKVPEPWLERLPAQHSDETDLLAYVHNAGPDSRLACQIRLTEALDGLQARVPGSD